MTAGVRVYIEVYTVPQDRLLALRDEIQKLNPDIRWIYDDAVQILEMDGYQKWWNAEECLRDLCDRFPEHGLVWEITPE